MIAIFKKNLFVVSLLILVYILVLRINTLIYPIPYIPKEGDGYLSLTFYTVFSNPLVQAILAIVLLFVQSLMINRIGIKHKINRDIGLLPGAIYALFICLIPYETALPPVLIANTFVIVSLQYIFSTYNKRQVAKAVFSSGLAASIASLFYFPFLYFFFITTIGLLILRSFTLQERLQHLIGWFIPYVLLFVWEFWSDFERLVIPHYFENQYAFIRLPSINGIHDIVLYALTGISVIYFIINYSSFSSKKEITVQKKIDVFYWLLAYGILVSFFYNYLTIDHVMTLALPIGYMLAMAFINMKNQLVPEIVHVALLGVWVYIQFY